MSLPTNKIICGDCVDVMRTFPADSIDCVVTSPPYWGLRDYGTETIRVWGGNSDCEHEWGIEVPKGGRTKRPQDYDPKFARGIRSEETNSFRNNPRNFCIKCGAWRGQLGQEPHPEMYINHLVLIFREVKRVLKPTGTFWLNLGDTYFGGKGKSGYELPYEVEERRRKRKTLQRSYNVPGFMVGRPQDMAPQDGAWLQPKQLLGIPWRVTAALQEDGWILRNAIVWHKPNHMPSSVKDRLTNAYEFVFLFAKQRRYWFDLDAIRVPHQTNPFQMEYRKRLWASRGKDILYQFNKEKRLADGPNTGARNKAPYKVNNPHISRITKGREAGNIKGKNPGDVWTIPTTAFSGAHFATFPPKLITLIIKAGCVRDGVVLDPFGGSGTVGFVARRLNRRFILIDIKPEYCEMARRRVRGFTKNIPENVIPLDILLNRK